jgi:hypothetical protein
MADDMGVTTKQIISIKGPILVADRKVAVGSGKCPHQRKTTKS